MNQIEKAQRFATLHQPGTPLVLYNIWDAGSAKAVVDAGAAAVATGSWSVAAAHGYPDGETIPLDLLLTVAARIAATAEVPLSVDFEGGYAVEPEDVAANMAKVLAVGAIGVNFEDRVLGGEGLHGIEAQGARIAAVRAMAEEAGVPFFINARTDLFLSEPDRSRHAAAVGEAKERAAAYAEAGASGFFAPALVEPDLIAEICTATTSPVNVMMAPGAPSLDALAECGVARVSYGPGPHREAMATLRAKAAAIY